MPYGPESEQFEELLRRRGIDPPDTDIDRIILQRYQDVCAVLVLDASSFTVSVRQHGIIHHLARIVALRDLVRPLFKRYHAMCHWPEADNLIAVFNEVDNAVTCALAIQDRVARSAAGTAAALPVGIGIGWGPLLRIAHEDVWGEEMNLAHKLGEDTAEPGDILLTAAAYEQAGDALKGVQTTPGMVRHGAVAIPHYAIRVSPGP